MRSFSNEIDTSGEATHLLWLVRCRRNLCRHVCRFWMRLFVRCISSSVTARFRRFARFDLARLLARRLFVFRTWGVTGPLADRWGSRRLAVSGMILTGLGLGAASVARNLTEVYAAYGLGVGLGIGCSYVPAVGAVTRWFVRRRGFASGLAVSGIGVGTLLVPPLVAWSIDVLGWRGTYLILGVFAIVVGAGMALLIEDGPRGPRFGRGRRSADGGQ